ncbi:alpha/beta fold hydrolase [Octadecabacter sp. 1_MG-2023]|uniref:alpha/beta fold hydrolase n=1 Tax=unclassified Octadecabacter TaxID=196158 RepID=UPI001C09D2E4|nr:MULTISPECIES: alpha/beta fold hydrolase [unclassified Octadecabacter]MBU2994525.1 alpha/beta fold hydrolase [Octadecabacter sp. B2R22]MDO6734182.1 alpha/beta fold hydrolase [Octadecabacter sp. 1_MG-2023]
MTTTHKINAKGATLFATESGSGPTLVYSHCLGLDHRVWDGVVERLPNYRSVRYDLRGHGQSDAPDGPYGMGTLISDAEAVCDNLDLRDVVFVGLSVGGMVAQGLAVKRLDLVRGMVMIASAAKVGQPEPWHERAKAVRESGMQAIADTTMERWNAGEDRQKLQEWLLQANPEGYAATCEALAGTDFYTPTSGLRLPTLGMCGNGDKAMPPDLVRETTDLVPGSQFHLIRGAGHITAVTHADDIATKLTEFLSGIGHV